MKTVLAVLVVCLVVAGCEWLQRMGGGGGGGVSTLACGPGNCPVRIMPDESCTLAVCGGTVDKPTLHLKSEPGDVHIHWAFDPPSGHAFHFCKEQDGDGAVLKPDSPQPPSGQFSDSHGVDNGSSNTPSTEHCTKQWHWKAVNKEPGSGKEYRYKLVFRRASDNKPFVIDPAVVND